MSASPNVMIVGAGLGGLMLAILLDKMGVQYRIFERSTVLKPYGAAMGFGSTIMPIFEQLGMLDDLLNVSSLAWTMDVLSEDLSKIGSLDIAGNREKIGYDAVVFSRPDLHRLLLSKVPAEKILYGKKVASVEQNSTRAVLHCADGTQYEGDILIGADGAYSAVRHSLYEELDAKGLLPKSDLQSLSLGYTCLVGTTRPLDPETYPALKGDHSNFSVVIADGKPHSCTILTVPGNRICYGVVIQLSPEERELASKNSEWGSQTVDSTTAKLVEHKIPLGGTLGDLIKATPQDMISNVYLEEKLFDTWTHGRIALLGDACHKMLPSAGQGAVNALQDAIVLANCIYDLSNKTSVEQVSAALEDYREQRYAYAKMAVENSGMAGRLLYGQTWFERLMRRIVMGWMPKWLEENNIAKSAAYQPRAMFLPAPPKRGTIEALAQKPSERYQEEQRQAAAAASV